MDRDLLNSSARLQQLSAGLDLDVLRFVNPTNSVEERSAFFNELKKRKAYNPRFTYLPKNPLFAHFTLDPEYDKIRKQLLSIYTDKTVLGKMLNSRRAELLAEMELVKSIGSSDFTSKSTGFYGKPNKKLVEQAFKALELKPKRARPRVSAEKAKAYLAKAFARHGINFQIEFDPQLSASAVVFPSKALLKLRKGTLFSREEVKRLELHEIKTHVYRYLNGLNQPFKLFAAGTSKQWHMVDEGLAAVNEELFGLLKDSTLKAYAGRAIAIDYSLEHSFFETFKFLKAYFPKSQAYTLTQRAKRGLFNTELNGAFTKDMIYLQGMNKVKRFLETGNSIEQLYFGRVGLEEAKVSKDLANVKAPKLLPNYAKTRIV